MTPESILWVHDRPTVLETYSGQVIPFKRLLHMLPLLLIIVVSVAHRSL
jgi:hypothetical protein